ncbi:MAG: transglycosylase SLT domain-containing protein [Pseudomonadales bacterium]|nr:transglycosylase SLT domain-containing protein [Pseudomonadales bacterium]
MAAERFIKTAANNDDNDRLREFFAFLSFFSALALADQGVPLTRTTDILEGYQESKLDQSRVSHRGAIGIMQVLPTTAKDPKVNIDNIEELENNIHAAAKYLHVIQLRYYSSPDISPWHQRLFTWAAYNAGPANVTRLRNAAARKGYDENVWFGNVEVMAAYMISREPIRYVANIHKYYTAYRLLEQREMQRVQALEAQVELQ